MRVQDLAARCAVALLAGVALAALPGCDPSSGGPLTGPSKRAPVARDDVATVSHHGWLQLDVLANDGDGNPEGDPFWIESIGTAAHGDVLWLGGGLVRYQPAAAFSGEDAFSYAIVDGFAQRAAATVRVTVRANEAPVAWAFPLQTAEEDAPVGLLLGGADLEDVGGLLEVELVGTPARGSVDLGTPTTSPRSAIYTPPPDWSGSDRFFYRVVDTDGAASEPVAVELSVLPVNDPPVATPVATTTTPEETPLAVVLTGTDRESPVDALEVEALGIAGPLHGTLSLPVTPSRAAPLVVTYLPAPEYAGPDEFTFRVRDPDGAWSEPATVSVMVIGVNDPPLATPVTAGTSEDVPVAVLLTGTDVDSPLSGLRVEILTVPGHGTLGATSLPSPSSVTYTPDPDWSGTDRFAFRVADPDGALSDPAEAVVVVAPVNDPPSATPVAAVTTDEDVPVTLLLSGADPDDAVTSLVAVVVIQPAHGTVTPSSGEAPLSVTFTPAPGWSGSDTLAFQVRDPAGALSPASVVSLTVDAANDAPVAVPDQGVACAGTPTRLRVLANDSDPEGDALTLAAVGAPAQGAAAIEGDAIVYTAGAGATGTDAFTYSISDAGGLTATGLVTVTASGPELLSLLPASGTTGGPLQIRARCLGAAQGTVTIGGRPAVVTTWTPRYVVATVPTGFDPGVHEVVVTPAGGAPLVSAYEVVPWISLVEPYYAAPGEAQALLGDAFGPLAGTVGYGGALAAVDGWTGTAIQSRIPAAGVTHVVATTASGATTNAFPVTGAGPDTWQTERVPGGRSDHTAVWTGTELIVFGGRRPNGAVLMDGGRYDPRRDAWIPIAPAALAGYRTLHTAVWTGSEMILWGGSSSSGPTSTGLRYRPGTDTWTETRTDGAPVARDRHGAVWTGARMIVWGGSTSTRALADGGSYDPATDQWTALSTTGAPSARHGHAAAWTGKEMLVWGGVAVGGVAGLDTGARYDPAADRWTPMSRVGAPSPRSAMAAVWTGEELVVWGGWSQGGVRLADGGRYDPLLDVWRPLAVTGAPPARSAPGAVWTGRELVVWGGTGPSGGLGSGGRYDPAADTWGPLDAATAPTPRQGLAMAWTGAEAIVWGGVEGGDTGARYDPLADRWTPTRSGAPGEPAARRDHAWACLPGGDLVIWGGVANGAGYTGDGARYRASAGSWTPLATDRAPSPRQGATAVWTGTHLLVWGGSAVSGTATRYLGDGARYDPALDEWTAIATTGAPSPRAGHSATWAGGRMIVFGGRNAAGALSNGAAYDPLADAWEATPTLNAPVARLGHTAITTGTELIVWGGETTYATPLATGARLDLASWIWLPLPAGPTARSRHTAIWTGDEMIVIGGAAGTAATAVAGRYIPRLGAWGATTAPYAFYDHASVWTGSEVITWGGTASLGPFRYSPATRAWTSSAAFGSAPPVRGRPSICWTGAEVVVWGGASGSTGVGSLGRYRP